MTMTRRSFLTAVCATSLPVPVFSQVRKRDELSLGITLEPPGLDPTVSASSSISEVCLYNLYETLTKIMPTGEVVPLLAHRWEVSRDAKRYTFYLQQNVFFHNQEPFNAETVAFTLRRAGAEGSVNKDRAFYANIKQLSCPDAHTVNIELEQGDPDFPFKLGMGTAVMVEPKSVATNRTHPIGTGPYLMDTWRRGAALTLNKWEEYRHADQIKMKRAIFRFVSDSYAQMASLLSGDVDLFARVAVARSLPAFTRQPDRFQVQVSNSRAKTLIGINHRRQPLNDVRVRQALAAAIDREQVIEGAADGYGLPIGSHYTPDMPGYIDTTSINAYDPERAKFLLKQANIQLPLTLDFVLPPAPYARQGGEIIAFMLSKIGIHAKIQAVEWAQWLSKVYTQHDYDLSMVSHVEPLDLDNYIRPDYYWGYQSEEFNQLYAQSQQTVQAEERAELLAKVQRKLAEDVASVWLYQPQWITVAHQALEGIGKDMPIFVNDLSSLSWC